MKFKILGVVFLIIAVITFSIGLSFSNLVVELEEGVQDSSDDDQDSSDSLENGFEVLAALAIVFILPLVMLFAFVFFATTFMFFGNGLLFLRFERVKKTDRMRGVKIREKQNKWIVRNVVIYWVILICFLLFPGSIIPLGGLFLIFDILGLFVFSYMRKKYVKPFRKCKKYFIKHGIYVYRYLNEAEVFHFPVPGVPVMASNSAIFFPDLMCVIPKDCVLSLKTCRNGVIIALNDMTLITVRGVALYEVADALNYTYNAS